MVDTPQASCVPRDTSRISDSSSKEADSGESGAPQDGEQGTLAAALGGSGAKRAGGGEGGAAEFRLLLESFLILCAGERLAFLGGGASLGAGLAVFFLGRYL